MQDTKEEVLSKVKNLGLINADLEAHLIYAVEDYFLQTAWEEQENLDK